jgi:hypothetical protein
MTISINSSRLINASQQFSVELVILMVIIGVDIRFVFISVGGVHDKMKALHLSIRLLVFLIRIQMMIDSWSEIV